MFSQVWIFKIHKLYIMKNQR